MGNDRPAGFGAAAGALGVGLYVIGALVIGDRPDFDAAGSEVAAHLDEERARIQVGVALDAAATPFLVWFLATVASLTATGTHGPRRAAMVAFGCGLVFITLFLADITALAVGALRPGNMTNEPELAAALIDFEWLAQGVATPLVVAVLLAFAVLVLRDRALWPAWIGWLALIAAAAYAPRIGTLFTTEGQLAADGLFGLYVPVGAFTAWIVIASVALARRRPANP